MILSPRVKCQGKDCTFYATSVLISVFRNVNGRTSGVKGYYCKSCLKESIAILEENNVNWESATLWVDDKSDKNDSQVGASKNEQHRDSKLI